MLKWNEILNLNYFPYAYYLYFNVLWRITETNDNKLYVTFIEAAKTLLNIFKVTLNEWMVWLKFKALSFI